MKKIEMAGKKFSRLTVVLEAGKDKSDNVVWDCQCDCGNSVTARGDSLRSGNTKSCGCIKSEIHTTHGMWKTPEYESWRGMIQRCSNTKNVNYDYYGGRGITVCARWLKFENFFEDMGKRPECLTIERMNNELGYFKENCKWASRTEQCVNQRINKNNKTGVRGVYWNKREKKYHARIGFKRQEYHLGYFDTIEEAAIVRKRAEERIREKERCSL